MSLLLTGAVFAGVVGGLDLFLALTALLVLGAVELGASDGAGIDAGALLLAAPAAALYLMETFSERRPSLDLLWRQCGAFVRPIGAAGLALMIIQVPGREAVAVAFLSALIAAWVQATRSGWALLQRLRARPRALRTGLILEDALVLGLVLAWRSWPEAVPVLAGIPLLVIIARSPPSVSAFLLSLKLTRGRLDVLAGTTGWRSPVEFPRWMKERLAPTGIVTGGRLRGVPAHCVGPTDGRWIHSGWLVVRGRHPLFARRTRAGVEGITLSTGTGATVRSGPLWSSVTVSATDGGELLVVIPKSGPDADELFVELQR